MRLFLKKETQKEHTYTLSRCAYKRGGGGGLYQDGLISRAIQNNIFVSKSMGLYPRGLKLEGFKVGFYGIHFSSPTRVNSS